jgi:hypothetical protein
MLYMDLICPHLAEYLIKYIIFIYGQQAMESLNVISGCGGRRAAPIEIYLPFLDCCTPSPPPCLFSSIYW